MKKRKTLFGLIFVIGMLFASVVEAAAPNSFYMERDTSNIINYDQSIVSGGGNFTPLYFPLKYNRSGNYLVFCSGDRSANTVSGTVNKTNFTNAYDRAVAAAIMKAGVGENALKSVSKEKILITQMAIWKSLPNTGNAFASTEGALNATQRTLYNNLISAGSNAKTAYNDISNFNITLNATSLTFTLSGDNYVSQAITVSGKQIKSVSTTVNKGTVEKSGNNYVVKVPKSQLAVGNNTINLTFNATSNSIPLATNYTNGNSAMQTVTTTQFDSFDKSDSESIAGVIKIEPKKVSISKRDIATGNELPGATLELTYPDGHKDTWESQTTPKELTLAAGKYTLRETIAPDGYVKSSEVIEFTVKSDGTVDKPVIMKNSPLGDIYISKQDATTGNELPGATLELKDSKGNVVDSWTSGETPHKVKVKLEAGKYTLSETIAPKGYVKNTKTVVFTVEEDGTVKTPVIMENVPKDYVYISKQDVTTGEELPGAILVLTDKNGKEIDSWTSGETPHKVKTVLEVGTYTLTETIAPDGYIKSTEAVTFKVNEDGTTDKEVVMYNKPEEVPDNPKTGSIFMYSLMIAFVSFAVSLYYYADTKLKSSKK